MGQVPIMLHCCVIVVPPLPKTLRRFSVIAPPEDVTALPVSQVHSFVWSVCFFSGTPLVFFDFNYGRDRGVELVHSLHVRLPLLRYIDPI